jgi:hypothetical protein
VRLVAVFWRAAVLVFLARQFLILGAVMRLPRWQMRVWTYVFGKAGAQRSVYYAIILGAFAALVAAVVARVLVGPAVRRWLTPGVDETEALFQLPPGERLHWVRVARRRLGRSWVPGTLLATDRSVSFLPATWDGSPWKIRRDALECVRFERWRLAGLDWLDGLPPNLVLWSTVGAEERFALLADDEVLTDLAPGDINAEPTPALAV